MEDEMSGTLVRFAMLWDEDPTIVPPDKIVVITPVSGGWKEFVLIELLPGANI